MPVVVDPVTLDTYARSPPEIDRDWLGRATHLTAAEVESAQRRTGDTTQLGYAVQLVTSTPSLVSAVAKACVWGPRRRRLGFPR